MIVTVKNEVNEPEVRQGAHRNKGLRGPSRQYKRQDKNRFFQAGNLGYISTRFDPFRLQGSFPFLYLLLSMESLEPSGAREPHKTACG